MRLGKFLRAGYVGLLVAAAGSVQAAGPVVQLKVDHVHLLRLDRDAETVYLANPLVADVTVDSPRRIFVLGRQPGTTNLIVLDANGDEILTTNLTVTGPVVQEQPTPSKPATVTVNRGTASSTLVCTPRCADAGGSAAP